jgi:hypothetical protein
MIRQVLWGFEDDLYEQSEYHYVCYYLEYVLHINEKNNNYFTNKLDKSILDSKFGITQVTTTSLSLKNRKSICQSQKSGSSQIRSS